MLTDQDIAIYGDTDAKAEIGRLREKLESAEQRVIALDRQVATINADRSRLAAETAEAKAVVRALEWSGERWDSEFCAKDGAVSCCPSCRGLRVRGHAADCDLAAVLGERPLNAPPLDRAVQVINADRSRLAAEVTEGRRDAANLRGERDMLVDGTEGGPAERTPETVLRAMHRAYSEARFDAAVDAWNAPGVAGPRASWLYACSSELMSEHRRTRVYAGAVVSLSQPGLQVDYAARLRGERPLNAPPAEV
jgi:hypothetical protein